MVQGHCAQKERLVCWLKTLVLVVVLPVFFAWVLWMTACWFAKPGLSSPAGEADAQGILEIVVAERITYLCYYEPMRLLQVRPADEWCVEEGKLTIKAYETKGFLMDESEFLDVLHELVKEDWRFSLMAVPQFDGVWWIKKTWVARQGSLGKLSEKIIREAEQVLLAGILGDYWKMFVFLVAELVLFVALWVWIDQHVGGGEDGFRCRNDHVC